jgi:hypothetical protein
MNLQQQDQFYQMMSRLKANSSSRAASTKEDKIITEVVNGLIVSKPAKKIEYLSTSETQKNESEAEPIVIDLQEQARKSKAGSSVPNINKLKVIHDFIHGKH